MQILIKAIDEIHATFHHLERQASVRYYREQIIRQYLHQNNLNQNHLNQNNLNHISQDIQFARNEYGKPFITGQQLAFNHSHSKQISALVLSEDYQHIGIDIEQLNRKVRFEAMAKHCFHADEYQAWQAQGKTVAHWFKIWTVKEAVLKAHGLGIRLNLHELNTKIEQNTQYGTASHPKIGQFQFYCEPCCVITPQGRLDFMLAVAWESQATKNHISVWNMVYR